MGTYCAPLVADLFLLCYERGLSFALFLTSMLSLSFCYTVLSVLSSFNIILHTERESERERERDELFTVIVF